ncbi:MAG: hypothetical protein ACI39F_02550, partial [Acutalibacteraceae bacterium]
FTVSDEGIYIVSKKATIKQNENGKTYIVSADNKTMVDTEGNCYGSATKATAQLHYRTAQRYNGSSVTGVTVEDKKTTGLGGGYCTSSGKPGKSMHGDTGYHTYGVFWTPTQLFYYCDDFITGCHDITDPQYFQLRECPQVALLTFPIGGMVPGDPNPALDKAEYLVDYVRVYQADDGYNTDPNYQGAYGFPELNDLDQPVSYYQEAIDAYSNFTALNAYNSFEMVSGAEQSIAWGAPFTYAGRVCSIKKSTATIKTLDKFGEGKYDIYVNGLKQPNKKDYTFLLNGVGIGTEMKLSEYASDKYGREYTCAASTYIGTAEITSGMHDFEITINEAKEYSSGFSNGTLLTVTVIKNDSSTPTVTLSGDEENTTITESTTTATSTTTKTTTSNSTSTTTTTTEKVDSDIWVYIGKGSNSTKTYTKTDYPDATDALQAAFDDVSNGDVTLSTSSFICVNQDITLTKQVQYTGSQIMRIKNLYTMTYLPTDTENATTAIYGNGATFYIYGADNAYTSGKQYVPYGSNAFFEKIKLQGGGYINGDLSIKDCMYLSKLGNYTTFSISNNLIFSGISSKNVTYYSAGGVTIEGYYDYSGVDETYKTYVAKIAETATINGKVISDPLTVNAMMKDGASIRLNNVNGIRFYTEVDTDKVDSLRSAGYTVELGTLIAPADNIQDKELSFALETGKYVDVKFNSATYYTEGEFTGIVGSLVNIKDTNITRDFAGRGYVKVTDTEGNETITYADYASNDVLNNTRSLQTVATALKNDTSDTAQTLYQNHKAMVDAWAEGKAYSK